MLKFLIAAAGLFIASGLQAQDAWPTKPVSMIAPFPPGGIADIVGRPLAARWALQRRPKLRPTATPS